MIDINLNRLNNKWKDVYGLNPTIVPWTGGLWLFPRGWKYTESYKIAWFGKKWKCIDSELDSSHFWGLDTTFWSFSVGTRIDCHMNWIKIKSLSRWKSI